MAKQAAQVLKERTVVDLFGWDMKEMWGGVQEDQQLLDQVASVFFRPIAEGYLPKRYRELLAGGRLVALSKFPKPGIRPICVGNAWSLLVSKGLLQICQENFENVFQFDMSEHCKSEAVPNMEQPTCFIFYQVWYEQSHEQCQREDSCCVILLWFRL